MKFHSAFCSDRHQDCTRVLLYFCTQSFLLLYVRSGCERFLTSDQIFKSTFFSRSFLFTGGSRDRLIGFTKVIVSGKHTVALLYILYSTVPGYILWYRYFPLCLTLITVSQLIKCFKLPGTQEATTRVYALPWGLKAICHDALEPIRAGPKVRGPNEVFAKNKNVATFSRKIS